jgi:hypothetical protein
MDLFYEAIGMQINIVKSLILYSGLLETEYNQISHVLPYQVGNIDYGLKYLGFHLKSNQ